MTTKTIFLATYRAELFARYEWAKDQERLDNAMEAVRATLNGKNCWMRSGISYETTLKALGLPKRITLKALQQLED